QDPPGAANIASEMLLWIPAFVASWLLLSFSPGRDSRYQVTSLAAPSDMKWKVGARYGLLCGFVPVFLLGITGVSIAMQNGPVEGIGRKRFGPDAYWRQTANLVGAWQPIGITKGLQDTALRTVDLPLRRLTFSEDRVVTAILPSGKTDDTHQWFLKNQYIWVRWHGKSKQRSERVEVPLEFRGQRFYLAWPPDTGGDYLVFERVPE